MSPETPAMLDYLVRQRWFAGDGPGWELVDLDAYGWLDGAPEGLRVRYEIVTVDGPGGRQTYNLPTAYRSEPIEANAYGLIGTSRDEDGREEFVYDALHDPQARQVLMAGFFTDARVGGIRYATEPSFHATDGDSDEPSEPIGPDSESVLLAVEQSNTSMIVDEVAMLKVFRKVVLGRNPDVEIHDALAGPGDDAIAALWGWVCTDTQPGEGYDLAMLQRFLRTATSGWDSARASVRDLLAEPDLAPQEAGGDFAGEAERLGEAVALVHTLMAQRLTTASWGAEELAALADRLTARMDALVARVEALAPYADAARAVYDQLRTPDGSALAQRVHGDLHLGQTLRTTAGWKLIDFEGEPAAPLAERTALDSPLRDIAGMLRSFDYAARSSLLQSVAADGDEVARAEAWARRNRGAFLRGYASGRAADAAEPASSAELTDTLMRAYEIDKALYEYVYEIDHRPDWVAVPATALDRLLER
ncbi:maltokinase [Mumia flava]|uniref:Maltokinase n=1 Tax=Mumia flava TaxID=1348852 RepID=A0A0B2BVQ5_9ACTN|nr:hypothetical protein [Mumia flava]PJJ54167.1 maltokinase [Mumia flava]